MLESCGDLKGYAFFVERARIAEAEFLSQGKDRKEEGFERGMEKAREKTVKIPLTGPWLEGNVLRPRSLREPITSKQARAAG
ncbi:MAG: hypothetical protein FWD94_04680 [Treponema sp.]|nr:hypothetical protein [Treponema sp.]